MKTSTEIKKKKNRTFWSLFQNNDAYVGMRAAHEHITLLVAMNGHR